MASGSLLNDGWLGVRPFEATDAAAAFAAITESIDELRPWLPSLAAITAPEDFVPWIASETAAGTQRTAHDFAIVDMRDGSLLGGAGLSHFDWSHRHANLYYWVRRSRVRQGIATGAARLLARYAFEVLALNRMEIVVAVDNQASLRVAEKVGAVREGVLRHRIMLQRELHDAVMFSLLPSDGLP